MRKKDRFEVVHLKPFVARFYIGNRRTFCDIMAQNAETAKEEVLKVYPLASNIVITVKPNKNNE